MKRGIALFLALVLILGTLPATAFATGGTLEGEGTKDIPYQIRDAEDLMAFGALVDEGNSSICGELLSSIDLRGMTGLPSAALRISRTAALLMVTDIP